MENEIMNNIEEVAKENVDVVTNVCTKGNLGKTLLTGAGGAAITVALIELGKVVATKIKAKSKHKKYITKSVPTSDEFDEESDK